MNLSENIIGYEKNVINKYTHTHTCVHTDIYKEKKPCLAQVLECKSLYLVSSIVASMWLGTDSAYAHVC